MSNVCFKLSNDKSSRLFVDDDKLYSDAKLSRIDKVPAIVAKVLEVGRSDDVTDRHEISKILTFVQFLALFVPLTLANPLTLYIVVICIKFSSFLCKQNC